MINVENARRLLDMGSRIGAGQRADEQLESAVALYNILSTRKVAYLADEVGMGKTYVALGALALFRHFDPDFRVLVLSPRENIQRKWQKEVRNFVANNVRFKDMRIKGADGLPVRPLVNCESVLDLVHQATISPDRDFFMRLTSFSLALKGKESADPEAAHVLRDKLREYAPWLDERIFDLRNRQEFKDNFAKAVCCTLPRFDLVIVDEGHNLKHGFRGAVSARNRVLGLAMGHPKAEADSALFPRYAARAKRVLFLSATPVEETYRHLWNQLDVFGLTPGYDGLIRPDVGEDEKKAIASQFLIRRVTSIRVAGQEYTKNLYRREWRRGGLKMHDQAIQVTDLKERLSVGLIQKKVAEILGSERFNSSFQIGMLASFESFLQTAKVRREGSEEVATFDDSDQAEEGLEKVGVDVTDVNRLGASFRETFNAELPHPKMDALVNALAQCWTTGEKGLVFVRRTASVKEIKRRLDDRYDEWLVTRLRSELPAGVLPKFEAALRTYSSERRSARNQDKDEDGADTKEKSQDEGGTETFFAWFFRGAGPSNLLSGARVQRRFIQAGTALATFFEDNYVASLLGCKTGSVQDALSVALGVSADALSQGLRARSGRFISSRAKDPPRADRFEAIQAAAIQWLTETEGPHQAHAKTLWIERFERSRKVAPSTEGIDPAEYLETSTFFTELRKRPGLEGRILPRSDDEAFTVRFREDELRKRLLASAARLGHAFLDFYVLTINRLGSLDLRAQESLDRDDDGANIIGDYLDLLEKQMTRSLEPGRPWLAYEELMSIAQNFALILDVNVPDWREVNLSAVASKFGTLLGQQQPVGGMAGQVNKTLVEQFRMPGYPFVMISTDLLQEGEDLHTFCSAVFHYGISWTPSSMEQRTGRVDRVRSATDRRLAALSVQPSGSELLQVYLPHLEDTVEVFQVQRVLERMNAFLRLMHDGLTQADGWSKKINVAGEMAKGLKAIPQYTHLLKTAFPVKDEQKNPPNPTDTVNRAEFDDQISRLDEVFDVLRRDPKYAWEDPRGPGALLGTATLNRRIQPFAVHVASFGSRLIVRCVSPIGNVGPDDRIEEIIDASSRRSITIGAIPTGDGRTYDLSIEGEVLLSGNSPIDVLRVLWLVDLIVGQADELEQQFLPGQDSPLVAFRKDLEREGVDGR